MTVTLRQGNMFHKAGSKLVVLDLLLISQLCLLFAGSYVIVNWRCTVWCNYPSYAHLLLCLTWQFHSKYLTLCVHTTHHNHSMQILLGSASNVTPITQLILSSHWPSTESCITVLHFHEPTAVYIWRTPASLQVATLSILFLLLTETLCTWKCALCTSHAPTLHTHIPCSGVSYFAYVFTMYPRPLVSVVSQQLDTDKEKMAS